MDGYACNLKGKNTYSLVSQLNCCLFFKKTACQLSFIVTGKVFQNSNLFCGNQSNLLYLKNIKYLLL